MKSEYSFEYFQKRKKSIKEKNKRTKRRLFILFLTTFSTVLMMFLFVANLITPEIDIPALNNEHSKMTDVRSSDFKKRIDSRLEQIKKDDDSPARIVEKAKEDALKQKVNKDDDLLNGLFGAQKVEDDVIKLDVSDENSQEPPVPEVKFQANEQPNPFGFNTSQQPEPPHAIVPAPPAPPAPYAPMALPQKVVKYKVFVGQFRSPQEARKLSEIISKTSNSLVKPFIKNYKGRYTIQIGSYGSVTKARDVAQIYSSYGAEVVDD